jgi:hypothetical protein
MCLLGWFNAHRLTTLGLDVYQSSMIALECAHRYGLKPLQTVYSVRLKWREGLVMLTM